ncbi:MAG TPA: hypothetical protein PLB89_11215 [Flavobacteriales bacterium]|nr:hypothetical protein [Flavobacteriales bacterium]
MRRAITAFLNLAASVVIAQPGIPEFTLDVVVTLDHELVRDGKAQYMVFSPGNDTLTGEQLRPLNEDSALSLQVHATSDVPWIVKYLPSGEIMELHIEYRSSMFAHSWRMPFTPGVFELEHHRILKCLNDQAEEFQRRDTQRPGWNLEHPFGAVDTLACHGGRLVYARGGGMNAVSILEMEPFAKRPPRVLPMASREASYPGGMSNFDRFIAAHFNKAMIERTNARVKLSATITIETDGSIHQVALNESAYPELDREFKRVLQLSTLWEPAVAENVRATIDPRTFRYVEQTKLIEYTADADSIWTELSDVSLTILPAKPTSNDELTVTFRWIGGSCGKYEAYAKVQPAPKDGGPRDVFLFFGQYPGLICADINQQSFELRMKALPPGRYRFRQMPHPKLEQSALAADPYRVKIVEVR